MEDIAKRRSRLKLLALRRGLLEAELALRPFVSKDLDLLSDQELDCFERLVAMEDLDLWEVLCGRREPPVGVDPELVAKVRGRLPGSKKKD